MSDICLLSTDFDGTLIGFGSESRCPAAFALVLEDLMSRGGLWAINTGRSLDHALDGIERFGAPFAPNFLLTNEREVFRKDGRADWAAHGQWNEVCASRHAELFTEAGGVLEAIEGLSRQAQGVRLVYENDLLAGLVTESEETMEEFLAIMESTLAGHQDFGYQRNTIYLRFCHRDYHKGSALGELCRLEGINPASVCAAGDHYNDLPMLDVRYAAYTACPSNAIPAVRDQVRRSGGYIAQKPWAEGVAEAVRHFESSAANRRKTRDPE